MRLSPRLIALVRRLLLVTAALATAIALLVAIENWRGDHAWRTIEREILARGEPLDFAALQPKPVTDEQNLFKAPLLSHLLYSRPDDPVRKKILAETRLMAFQPRGEFRGRFKDFASLRDALVKNGLVSAPPSDSPAADVLTALRPMQSLLDDIQIAAQLRPKAALESRAIPLAPPDVDAEGI